MNFTNKVIWITGASSGIGKALALELSQQDCKLILSSRREAALIDVKKQCSNSENIKIFIWLILSYVDKFKKKYKYMTLLSSFKAKF